MLKKRLTQPTLLEWRCYDSLVGIGCGEYPELTIATVEDDGGQVPSDPFEPGRPNLVVHVANNFCVPEMGTTVRSALYVTLLEMIVSKTEYKRCPNCEELFIVTVKRKKFCKEACQNTAKTRRFRARHKKTGQDLPTYGAAPLPEESTP